MPKKRKTLRQKGKSLSKPRGATGFNCSFCKHSILNTGNCEIEPKDHFKIIYGHLKSKEICFTHKKQKVTEADITGMRKRRKRK